MASSESTGVQEVIVTAQRRAERLEDVPASVTAISAAGLDRLGISSINDIGRGVPALNITRTSAFTQPTIRGIGNSVTGAGVENNVALYVDGFYQPSGIGNAFELNNIEHIEVLKGPQGTLFGRNATGGAILVTTREPTFDPHAELLSRGKTDAEALYADGTYSLTDSLKLTLGARYRLGAKL